MSDRPTLTAPDAPLQDGYQPEGGSAEGAEAIAPPAVQSETIRQTVLGLAVTAETSALYHRASIHLNSLTSRSAAVAKSSTSASVLLQQAMHQLVNIVTELRSPEGGWPAHVPQTPENLAPYISEEAHEVLEALQQEKPLPSALPEGLQLGSFMYLLVETLVPQVLWEAARSSYEVMRLLGGIPVQAFQPGQPWSSGLLRLVGVLHLQTPGAAWSFDLVSQQPERPEFLTEALIQSSQTDFYQTPVWVGGLLSELMDHLRHTAPLVQTLLNGLSVDVLQPDSNWRTGQLHLELGFEFLPESALLSSSAIAPAAVLELDQLLANAAEEDELEAPSEAIESVLDDGTAPTDWVEGLPGDTAIQFLDQAWVKTNLLAIAQRQVEEAIRSLPHVDGAALPLTLDPLIQTVYAVVENPPTSAQGPGYALVQPESLLRDLIPRLLWSVTRSDYLVMRLVGGVAARYLQPECDWQVGHVHLRPNLIIQTETQRHLIDLGSGVLPNPSIFPLPANALIQSLDPTLCSALLLIETLHQDIMQRLRQGAPDLAGFLQGTQIQLRPTPQPHAGVQSEPFAPVGYIQLQLELEFLPTDELFLLNTEL